MYSGGGGGGQLPAKPEAAYKTLLITDNKIIIGNVDKWDSVWPVITKFFNAYKWN
jgi:hypothetical protein